VELAVSRTQRDVVSAGTAVSSWFGSMLGTVEEDENGGSQRKVQSDPQLYHNSQQNQQSYGSNQQQQSMGVHESNSAGPATPRNPLGMAPARMGMAPPSTADRRGNNQQSSAAIAG